MFDSRSVMGLSTWWFAAACLFVFSACGGTVRSSGNETGGGGSESGGTAGTAGRGGRSSGGSAGTKSCGASLTRCGSACVDTQSDDSHCGACFSACTTGVPCVNSTCQISSGNGGSNGGCSAGLTYCSNFSRCLDVRTNPFACGSCYSPCSNSEACVDGRCVPGTCFNGLTDCSGSDAGYGCADLTVDRNNCGSCGHACGIYESCQDGQCIPPVCSLPYEYCVNSGCTDTTTDLSSCGRCGHGCAGGPIFDYTGYVCTNGQCACAPLANKCGTGCSTQFWYCPPTGSMASPMDICTQLARNAYEQCACKNCLAQVTSCAKSTACMNAMDCSIPSLCSGCSQTFTSCTDQTGKTDPLADDLVNCMNTSCAAP